LSAGDGRSVLLPRWQRAAALPALLAASTAAAAAGDAARGQRWLEACGACHGAAADAIPALQALPAAQVVERLRAFRKQVPAAGSTTIMDRIAGALDDAAIDDIAAALEARPPGGTPPGR
jgi:cytochrome c553